MPKIFITPSSTLDLKTPLLRQLLAVAFASLTLPQLAHSEEQISHINSPLKLRLEDQLLVRPVVPDDLSPTFTSSKKLDGVMDRQMQLDGDAVIRRGRTVIKGDVIVYDPDTDVVDIEGNATLLKDTTYFKGTRAKLRVDAQQGWMEDPDYELRGIGGYGKADRVDFKEDNEFELENLTYSTCRPENLDWYLSASRMDVEQDTKSAVGTNAVLHFFNVPILYTPVFALPVGSERRSGFLSPTYGSVSRGRVKGWDITLPYYVNIAPNRDMTLFPRYIEGRGEQLGTEFRYLDRNYAGVVTAEVLDDAAFGKNRWAFSVKHAQNLATGLVGYTDFSKVSDNLYVDDLGKSLNGVINRQFNQEVGTRYTNAGWSILTRVQNYQTLQPDPSTPLNTPLPYDREPQVNAKYIHNNWNGLNLSFESDATRFTYKGLFNAGENRTFSAGNRAYAVSSIAKPFMTPGYYLTPKLTLRSTQYSVDPFPGQEDFNRNVTLPTFSLDSGMVLERDALELNNIFNRNILMTLEPRIFYVNTPYKYQSDLPLFDTGAAGFGISQIFSENTFAGNDRIADNNKVTLGITSRILDAETGVERLRGILAQRIDMTGQQVTLTTSASPSSAQTQIKRSDLLAGLSTRLAGNFNLDGLVQYNDQVSKLVQQSITASYRPEVKKLINASYKRSVDINQKDINNNLLTTTDQYELSGQWPITRQWYGVARYNYDLISNRVLNRVAGLEYDADCWVVRLVHRRYQNTSVLATSEIFMQIDFKGFSGFGNNSIDLIRFNIPGYEPISPNPAPISPFESYE
jgi:LPS-assembly protein